MAFALLFALLTVRAWTDHSLNSHYLGDGGGETDFLKAANNFHLRGFVKSKFLPAFATEMPEDTTGFVGFYTHYPALPYLINGAPYVWFGESEFAARVVSVLVTLIGLIFALRFGRRVLLLCGDEARSDSLLALFFILISTPIVLCFGDTISNQPFGHALQWAALYWALLYLLKETRLAGGIFVAFLHVMVQFEWIVGNGLLFGFVLWQRHGRPTRNLRKWLALYGLGFVLPWVLRLAHNAWGLGGLGAAVHDLLSIASTRAAVDGQTYYSFTQHAAKFLLSLPWFTGVAALIAAVIGYNEIRKRFARQKAILGFFLFWAIGSLNWQFVMRQHALVHAFTYAHFASFLLFLGALGLLLIRKQKPALFTVLFSLQLIQGGTVVRSEIIAPAVNKWIKVSMTNMCERDRKEVLYKVGGALSPYVARLRQYDIQSKRQNACDAKSAFYKKGLVVSSVLIKASI